MIDTAAILAAIVSPQDVARRLGLKIDKQGARPHRVRVLCPAHTEKRPSCVVEEKAGRLVWRCHSCNAGSDFFGLVAAVHELDARRDFRKVAELAAELVGVVLPSSQGTEHVRPAASDVTIERLTFAIDSLADAWLRGGSPMPSPILRAATDKQIDEAMELLAMAYVVRAEREAEIDAALDAVGDELEGGAA